jgi:hypothetical protein
MFRRQAVFIATIACLSPVVLGSCGSSDALVLSLKSTQELSGANRSSQTLDADVADSKLAFGYDLSYKVTKDLPDLGSSATAWTVSARKETKTALRNLATSFGLPGDVVKHGKNSFSIGQDDKAGTGLWLSIDVSSAWWSYSSGAQMGFGTISSSMCAPDASKEVCNDNGSFGVEPPPPVNLPNKSAAIARVTKILTDAELPVSDFELTATTSDWSTEVVGTIMAEEVSTNISVYFSFGANGSVMYASGPLVELKDAGSYPIISPTDAVGRLSQMQYGLVGPTARGAADSAVSSREPGTSPPQSVEVQITGVRLGLMQTTLTNNSSILLPAYTYTNSDGDVGTVLAVEEKYFSFGDSEVSDGSETPTPVDPGTSDGSPGAGTGAAVSPTNPVALLDAESAQKLIGLSEDEARKVADGLGWTVRVAMRDGEAFMLTEDFQTNRVNLTVTKGSVTAVTVG